MDFTNWLRNTVEFKSWGLNSTTISALLIILVTLIEVVGLWSQNRKIWKKKSGQSLKFILFSYIGGAFLAGVVYGVYIGSLVLVGGGIVLSGFYVPILVGLGKYERLSRKDIIYSLLFLLMPVVVFCSPAAWREWSYLTFNVGMAIPMVKQFLLLKKEWKTGVVDLTLLVTMTFVMAFWIIYAFSIWNWPLMVINLILFFIAVAILTLWVIIRREELL